jgi:hypothetical protein
MRCAHQFQTRSATNRFGRQPVLVGDLYHPIHEYSAHFCVDVHLSRHVIVGLQLNLSSAQMSIDIVDNVRNFDGLEHRRRDKRIEQANSSNGLWTFETHCARWAREAHVDSSSSNRRFHPTHTTHARATHWNLQSRRQSAANHWQRSASRWPVCQTRLSPVLHREESARATNMTSLQTLSKTCSSATAFSFVLPPKTLILYSKMECLVCARASR